MREIANQVKEIIHWTSLHAPIKDWPLRNMEPFFQGTLYKRMNMISEKSLTSKE